MKMLRGVGAMLAFVIGLFALAGGLLSMAITWANAAQTHQPINLSDLALGISVCVVGIMFLLAARAIDPENGPVQSYRNRPRKSRTRA